MITAAGTMHVQNGFFASKNGFELNAFYVAAALALTFGGPGAFSLDGVLGLDRYFSGPLDATVIGAGVVIGLINLTLRHAAGPEGVQTVAPPRA
jgi:hypothetical protein